MRGAWGKPCGLVARVDIGDIVISVRGPEKNKDVFVEGLRRASMKFPGRQKVVVSDKWGFTKFTQEQYKKLRDENKLIPDGACVRVVTENPYVIERRMHHIRG